MVDVNDAIAEAVENAAESRLNSFIAVLVALSATFMALSNVKDGNISQSMAQAQAQSVDTWSFYQAKSTKQGLAEATVVQLTALRAVVENSPEKAAELEKAITENTDKIKRYETEKTEIKAKAEAFQQTYDELGVHDDQFDLSEAALSVAIALCGITALTQKRWLLGLAIVFTGFGFLFGVAGFFGWNIHPDFLMSWLT